MYIPLGYEENEIFEGLIIPKGNYSPSYNNGISICKRVACSGLNCDHNCLYGNEKVYKKYLILKKRILKINKIKERICTVKN